MTREEITDYVAELGEKINRDEWMKVRSMLVYLPIDEASEVYTWLSEGVALTVSDPAYEGDLTVEEL